MPRLKGLPKGQGSTREEGLRRSALRNHGVLHVRGSQRTKKDQSGDRATAPKGQTRCQKRTQTSPAW